MFLHYVPNGDPAELGETVSNLLRNLEYRIEWAVTHDNAKRLGGRQHLVKRKIVARQKSDNPEQGVTVCPS